MSLKNKSVGVILILIGSFIPLLTYPFAEHPSFIDFRQGEAVIVLKRGKQYNRTHLPTGKVFIYYYSDGTYLYYKHILAGGIILVFLGIGIITLNGRRLVTNLPKDKVP